MSEKFEFPIAKTYEQLPTTGSTEQCQHGFSRGCCWRCDTLSKRREAIATAVIQGLYSNQIIINEVWNAPDDQARGAREAMAQAAVRIADGLIQELDSRSDSK